MGDDEPSIEAVLSKIADQLKRIGDVADWIWDLEYSERDAARAEAENRALQGMSLDTTYNSPKPRYTAAAKRGRGE
jgi:hypothetical protein